MESQINKIAIKGCIRCGADHPSLQLRELTNGGEWTHWATCPKTNQPLMLKVSWSFVKEAEE